MSQRLEQGPIRAFLRERETYLPRKKITDIMRQSDLMGGDYFAEALPLPSGVNPEQAIEVVASNTWAQGIAAGVCGTEYAGFPPGSAEYKSCVYNVSHRVAARTLGLSWTPSAAAATPRKPRK